MAPSRGVPVARREETRPCPSSLIPTNPSPGSTAPAGRSATPRLSAPAGELVWLVSGANGESGVRAHWWTRAEAGGGGGNLRVVNPEGEMIERVISSSQAGRNYLEHAINHRD